VAPPSERTELLTGDVKVTNENESADFAQFYTKIGCHGNVP